MKKVLFLAYTYPPDSRSGTFRILHFANEIAARGNYRPFILTVDEKYYEEGVQLDKQLVRQVNENVTVIRTRSLQYRDFILGLKLSFSRNSNENISCSSEVQKTPSSNKTIWQQVKDIITEEICAFPDRQSGWLPFAVFAGIKTIRKEKIDIIFATGSPWTSFCAGALIKMFTNCPLIIDYRDPWNDNPFLDKKSKLFKNVSKFLERKIALFSNAIISNTHTFNQLLTTKYPMKKSLYTVHNGYLQKDIDSITIENNNHDNGELIFTYTGALYGHRSIDAFLIAFKDLITKADCSQSLRLQIIGVENNMKLTCERILGTDLVEKHCYIAGRIPHEQCLQYQMNSHCLLIFQQGTANQIPRKIFEYMAIRKPILAIVDCDGETSNLINKNRCGIVVNDSPDSIKSALEDMCLNYDKHLAITESNDSYKQYDVRELSLKIETIMDKTISPNTRS